MLFVKQARKVKWSFKSFLPLVIVFLTVISTVALIYFLLPFLMPIESGGLSNWLFYRQVKYGLVRDVNHQDRNGKTALIRAVEAGNINILFDLLQHKDIDLGILDKNHCSALNYANGSWSPDIIKLLTKYCLKKKTHINLSEYREMIYKAQGYKDKTKFLALLSLNKHVVNLNKDDLDNLLVRFLLDFDYENIKFVMQAGADAKSFLCVNVIYKMGDESGKETSLTCILKLHATSPAIQFERIRIMNYLINNGADPNMYNEEGCSPLMVVSGPERNKPSLDYYKYQSELLCFLIKNKADINLKTSKITNISYNCINRSEEKYIATKDRKDKDKEEYKEYLGSGTIIRHIPPGSTALTFAIHSYEIYRSVNDLEFISKLIENGADVNFIDSEGNTPLDIAKSYKLDNLIELLIKYNAKDELGT